MQIEFMCIYWMWLHWDQFNSIKTPRDFAELEHIIGEYYTIPPVSDSWQRSPFGKEVGSYSLKSTSISKSVDAAGNHVFVQNMEGTVSGG